MNEVTGGFGFFGFESEFFNNGLGFLSIFFGSLFGDGSFFLGFFGESG